MTKPEELTGKTDWARIRAMTDEQRLAGALTDPDAQPLSDQALARARRANGVKTIRARINMTQAEFSSAYHLPLSTVRDWEQSRNEPDARPARLNADLRAVRWRRWPRNVGKKPARAAAPCRYQRLDWVRREFVSRLLSGYSADRA